MRKIDFRRGVPLTKAQTKKLRYSKFWNRIDVDAFEEAIGWAPFRQEGSNDIGHCPDFWGLHKHGDTTGKFAIQRDKRIYNCWVCGGGTFLSLAMEAKGLDDEEATNWLYQFAEDGPIADDTFLSEFAKKLNVTEEIDLPLPWFNPNVLSQFDHPHPWFEQRGISEAIRQQFRAGYNPNSTRRAKKEEDEDYTGPSIILPHFWEGKLVGWQQRWLDEDRPKWIPKYTNTRDFPKNETIFNLDYVLKQRSRVVVVESVPTVMYLMSIGIPAVATFGSNVTDDQMQLLRKLQQGVYLWPDFDGAGAQWINDLSTYLDRYIEVREVLPVITSEGADANDLVPEAVQMYLSNADSRTLFKDIFLSE